MNPLSPLPSLQTFANVAPPWSAANLDNNTSQIASAVNNLITLQTYSGVLTSNVVIGAPNSFFLPFNMPVGSIQIDYFLMVNANAGSPMAIGMNFSGQPNTSYANQWLMTGTASGTFISGIGPISTFLPYFQFTTGTNYDCLAFRLALTSAGGGTVQMVASAQLNGGTIYSGSCYKAVQVG